MVTLKGERIVPEFLEILEKYVATRYGLIPASPPSPPPVQRGGAGG
jgi:hypothetical protein